MHNLPLHPSQYSVPLIICVISIILFVLEPASSNHFEYRVNSIATGEYFRLLTGHFLHTNFIHLMFNIFGFVLLWALHGDDYSPLAFSCMVIFLCLGVSLMMYVLSPSLAAYVGLSGILHGIFAWGVIQDINKKMITGYFLFIGLVLKVGSEQLFGAGSLMPSLIDANVATQSHLYGAVLGMAYAVIGLIIKSRARLQN